MRLDNLKDHLQWDVMWIQAPCLQQEDIPSLRRARVNPFDPAKFVEEQVGS